MNAQLLKMGIKVGGNYANVSGSEIQTQAITSYHGGLMAEVKLLKKLFVQPEILYSTQGTTYKTAIEDYRNELGYLTIPVMLKIGLSDTFSLDLGPQASFLLKEKNKFDVNNAQTFDFSANAGMSVRITEHLVAQARYCAGLYEISENSKIKSAVFQLSVGCFF
ncbi:hypothetical protein FB1_15120 [Flavobacterium branchiophilum NBRC 15030 = ATCC 35035]|nr:hypothetical protein FB1_15120 [Flavobacterium branchiophilum NBRC 15030 = ATCC 35035]